MDMNLCVDLILPPHASTFEELIGDFGGRIRLRKNLAIAINLSLRFICLWCTEIFCSAHRLFVRSGDALICAPESFFEEICLLPIFVERERGLTVSTETLIRIIALKILKRYTVHTVNEGTAVVITVTIPKLSIVLRVLRLYRRILFALFTIEACKIVAN